MPPSRSRSRSRSPSPYSRRMALPPHHREDRTRSRSPPRTKNPLTYSPSPPRRHHRSPSRSPRRRHDDRHRKSTGGFRWKEKPPRYEDDYSRGGRRDERNSERGYREAGERERERQRRRSPGERRDRDVERKFGKKVNADVEEKFGRRDEGKDGGGGDKPLPTSGKRKKEKKTATMTTGEPMIVVNVNDRLGTKASIPCMASDPIRLFKAQVAAVIGRQPHEIMLKRQGERPFKDQLTLEDYGVSNGVQLDLEVDTGD